MCELCPIDFDYEDVDVCGVCEAENCEACKEKHSSECECEECMRWWSDEERESHLRMMRGIVQGELSVHACELFEETTHCLVGDYEWGPPYLNQSWELRLRCASCGVKMSVTRHGVRFASPNDVCAAVTDVAEVMES